MTYHIPSALDMLLLSERDIKKLHFRTDRRYVRCNGAYPRFLRELTQDKMAMLSSVHTTQEAYDVVRSWYFFGRYAAFLFLEVYIHVFQPDWVDNIQLGWEADENYTKGAILVAQSNEVWCKVWCKGDIIQLRQHPWGRAQGFNSSSSEKRAKFLGMSMADYMQWLWNNPQSGQSPYKLFEGALNPHGKDGDGNLIYTYSGTQF